VTDFRNYSVYLRLAAFTDHLKWNQPRSNAEVTEVQMLNIAVRQEEAVILPALIFLLLFVSRQKANRLL